MQSRWCAWVPSLLILWQGTDGICRHSNSVYASCCVFIMFKKTKNPVACEMRSVIRFLNHRTWHRLKFIVTFVTCMENMPWVVQWYGDGCDCLMRDAKMCMMIRGAADRLWWMKIWCVQLKRTFGRTDDSPLRSLLHKIVSEVKEAVTTCFASQAAPFYDEGIQKLVQRYDKCLNNGRNYVEK